MAYCRGFTQDCRQNGCLVSPTECLQEDDRRSCFPSRQSNSLHLPLITSLVPHYLHLVLTPFSPAAHPLVQHTGCYLRQSEKDSTANLEMQYPPPFAATLPSTDATLTIRPRAFLMSGRKIVVIAIHPFMLTFSMLW
ncbi:hypothetical protein EYF80_011074 [Liparis tanakae]|uniref:Uncharacterized protein n=1 Tax=Liparis tanakae TaxID=230148 RepID=A0A4Z2IKV0_9TELE|nr:hypothetical protein EYF80_011074 [Liparis tanakae]